MVDPDQRRDAGRDASESRDFLDLEVSPTAARGFVAGVIERWGRGDLVADAELVTSELATNAIMHGAGRFRVEVQRSLGGADPIRISVIDAGPGIPRILASDPTTPGGLGLVIVDRVASAWGVDHQPVGKVVWAELR